MITDLSLAVTLHIPMITDLCLAVTLHSHDNRSVYLVCLAVSSMIKSRHGKHRLFPKEKNNNTKKPIKLREGKTTLYANLCEFEIFYRFQLK